MPFKEFNHFINKYDNLKVNLYKEGCYLMEFCHDNNIKNIKATKYFLEHIFDNLKVNTIEIIGSGYESIAYLVNNKYVFKIKYSANKKKSYKKEKAIYDYLNKNLHTDIQVPNIEYSYISDEISILGYKQIKGKFLNPTVYYNMSKDQQELLKHDIANFLRKMHDLDYTEISSYKIDNKQNVLEEYQLLRATIYDSLTDIEKNILKTL